MRASPCLAPLATGFCRSLGMLARLSLSLAARASCALQGPGGVPAAAAAAAAAGGGFYSAAPSGVARSLAAASHTPSSTVCMALASSKASRPGQLLQQRATAAAAAARGTKGYPASSSAAWAGRRLVTTGAGSGAPGPDAAQLAAAMRKARWISGPVGALAGVFGSCVGVGGGVIIVPVIVNACKTIPQRCALPLPALPALPPGVTPSSPWLACCPY